MQYIEEDPCGYGSHFYSLFSRRGTAADPIKVGYLAALTGDYAAYGITEVNMPKWWSVMSTQAAEFSPIELVIYDTKTRNEDAVNAVRRMIESDKVVAIIGANSSGINIATAPIVDRARPRRSQQYTNRS